MLRRMMKARFRSRLVLLMLLTLCAGLAGLAGSAEAAEVTYAARPYDHKGVTLNPVRLWLKKNKLWLRLLVINHTGKLLTIDKAQLQLKLPDGAQIAREAGVFGKYGKPHYVGPGLSHELNVEFMIGPVPVPVALVLRQGFIVDGRALPLPDYPLSPIGG